MISKSRLSDLTNPGVNIQSLQNSNPKLYQALKNLGYGTQQLINGVFPPFPQPLYAGRIIIPGIPVVATDILAHRYHVVMPSDPAGYYTFLNIVLTGCFITSKVAPAATPLSVDILVAKNKGLTAFQSIFKTGFNPILPVGFSTTHNVEFGINSLYQDDLCRVDILTTDTVVSDIELALTGYYNLQENVT